MESRFLRLSFGYTKIPPRMDNVEQSVDESEIHWKILEERTLPRLNASILIVQSRVQSLNESFDALTRKNARPAPARNEIRNLKNESLKLQKYFAAATEDLKQTKKTLAEDRKKIETILEMARSTRTTTAPARFEEEEERRNQAAVRLNGLEAAIAELKARVADLTEGDSQEERSVEDEAVETEFDRSKPGLSDRKNHHLSPEIN